MAIPSQVEEAATLAEQLHTRLYSNVDSEIPEGEEEDTSEVEDEDESGLEEEGEEIDTPHDDDLEELRKFKARYLSLKGKYDAEVPRLQHELRDLKTSVFERLETLADNPPQTKQEEKAQNDVITRLKEEYGDDFIDSVKLLAEQIAEEKIKANLTPVQEQVSSVEDTQIKIAKENFMDYLNTNVKGEWQKAWSGQDPKFIDFLNKPDPSGLYTYADLVQMYNDNWDAEKLSQVLNIYYESKPVPKQKQNNPEKEALVAPSRQAANNTPEADEKIIWTKDAIKEFQKLDRQGKYSTEEPKAKCNNLLAAPAEGRIRF